MSIGKWHCEDNFQSYALHHTRGTSQEDFQQFLIIIYSISK